MTDYEAAISFLGEWEPFQRRLFFLLSLTVAPGGLQAMMMVFVVATPAHRCVIPADANLSAAWRNNSIPVEPPGVSACARYRLSALRDFSRRGLMPGADVNLSHVEREGCLDGWEYDRSVYTETIVSEVKSTRCVFHVYRRT